MSFPLSVLSRSSCPISICQRPQIQKIFSFSNIHLRSQEDPEKAVIYSLLFYSRKQYKMSLRLSLCTVHDKILIKSHIFKPKHHYEL